MIGLDVPFNTYVHIMGVDLVRDGQGIFRVLEDNARVPSGVSYVVENRHMMMRAFPDLVSRYRHPAGRQLRRQAAGSDERGGAVGHP